jgi:hypothetical protein
VQLEQASIKASMAEFGDQIRQLQAQMVHQASTEGEPSATAHSTCTAAALHNKDTCSAHNMRRAANVVHRLLHGILVW